MKRSRLSFMRGWRPPVLLIVGTLLLAGLLVFRLGTLVPGLSAGEITARINSSSLHHILHNPVNAPYKLLVYVLIRLHHHGALALRGVATLYGLLALGLFFYVVRRWQGGRIAAFSTLLFGTSSWFLHTARSGTPNVLLFGLLAMVATGLWLRSTHRRSLAVFACIIAVAISLYIPGFIWFVLAAIIWGRRIIIEELRHESWLRRLPAILLFLLLIAPLVYAIYLQPHLALTVGGLPQQLPTLHSLARNALNIPLLLFVRGPVLNPAIWLNHLPVLDIFDIAMFVLGVYVYIRHWRLDRASLLLGIIVMGSLLVTAGGPVTITILVPFIYAVIACGIGYMLNEWFSIFPLNPFARSAGIILISVAILFSCSYQLERYFVAWPNNPATKAVYTGQT